MTGDASPDRGGGAVELGGVTSTHDRVWRWVAGFEVLVAVALVLVDWFIPAVVLVGLAAVSLVVRRRGPSSLGFHRPERPWLLVGQMAAFAVAWTLLNALLVIPVVDALSGTQQDTSGFADLEGNLILLVVYLVASWVLAALAEETAFRGYLLTRLTEVLGSGRGQRVVAVLVSATLFGLLHTEQGVVGVVAAGLAGVVFAVLRYRCRTLWAPVLAHGFDDTIGFTWFYFFGPFSSW